MRGRIALITTILLLGGLLLVLNAASYVRDAAPDDSEFNPQRSSYNAGPTGTLAFYEFLQESNYRAVRWRRPFTDLPGAGATRPRVLFIVGRTRLPVEEEEREGLGRWLDEGGRLIIVDRDPPPALIPALGRWTVSPQTLEEPSFSATPEKAADLVAGAPEVAPAQPTLLTHGVSALAPSRYAARLLIEGRTVAVDELDAATESGPPAEEETPPAAPLIHFADDRGAFLADYRSGGGRVIILSDPYVVANNGIARADNLQLALNLVGGRDGLVAFDEYHHGFGTSRDTLLAYFAGTPVPALAAQTLFGVLAFVWARSRRFARPLPGPRTDRRSKLEFITSMAELQMRARAYDLAVENIYARTRRVLARMSGTEMSATAERLAARVAGHSAQVRPDELARLLRDCEETIAGAPTNARQSLSLAVRLRRIERALGLRQRSREIKQAAHKH